MFDEIPSRTNMFKVREQLTAVVRKLRERGEAPPQERQRGFGAPAPHDWAIEDWSRVFEWLRILATHDPDCYSYLLQLCLHAERVPVPIGVFNPPLEPDGRGQPPSPKAQRAFALKNQRKSYRAIARELDPAFDEDPDAAIDRMKKLVGRVRARRKILKELKEILAELVGIRDLEEEWNEFWATMEGEVGSDGPDFAE